MLVNGYSGLWEGGARLPARAMEVSMYMRETMSRRECNGPSVCNIFTSPANCMATMIAWHEAHSAARKPWGVP